MDIKFVFGLLTSFASLCITIGVYMTKIKQLEHEIKEIKNKQDDTEILFNSINIKLTELDTKISLLLHGQINVGV